MKKFWSKVKEKLSAFWQFVKMFLSVWHNWVFVVSVISTIVFLSLWNVAPWCNVAGFGCLSLSMLFVALIFTTFYNNFVALINIQKRELLEKLAVQFDKQEYLQLETPFNQQDEQQIQNQIKSYKHIMIFFWIVFVICVYVFITLLLAK